MQGIVDTAHEDGALVCFDEVMTGFRIAKGCAQEHFGVIPDLTTLGKVIGGGLPVGAYGGRADIMNMVAPAGPMYQVPAPPPVFVCFIAIRYNFHDLVFTIYNRFACFDHCLMSLALPSNNLPPPQAVPSHFPLSLQSRQVPFCIGICQLS